jgi:hypothetical protein
MVGNVTAEKTHLVSFSFLKGEEKQNISVGNQDILGYLLNM